MLKNSGLQAQPQGSNAYLLAPAFKAAEGAMELGATTVSSTGLGSVTEHTGSYTTAAVSIGKTPNR